MRPGREHEGERNGVWKALEIGIEKARKRGSVVVLGDMNARFGETSSFLTQGDDVIEVRRNSIDTVVNGEGRNMISRLDGLGLVVLNGVKEKMEWTFDNRRGKSVVDIISTGKDSWQEWDSVKVARVDWMHSDHKLVKSVWRRSWALGKQSERKERIWRVWDLDKGREEGWIRLKRTCSRLLDTSGNSKSNSESSSSSSSSGSSSSGSSGSSGTSGEDRGTERGVEEVWKQFENKVRRSLKEGVGEKVIVVRDEIRREREVRVVITDANIKRRKENIRDILNNLKEGEREGWKIGKEEEVLRDRFIVERRALKRYCRKMR